MRYDQSTDVTNYLFWIELSQQILNLFFCDRERDLPNVSKKPDKY